MYALIPKNQKIDFKYKYWAAAFYGRQRALNIGSTFRCSTNIKAGTINRIID